MLIILLFWADMQDSEILNLFYLGGFSVWQCGEYQKRNQIQSFKKYLLDIIDLLSHNIT